MKILKKISLIFIGILLSLVILEAGLQIAGFTIITIKKYRNKISKDSNTITILCLGESTTDRKWPPILQKILNDKSKNKKFNVIDEGISGINTAVIADKLSNNLIKYNPDIVITMIGINDIGLGYKKYKFKIFSLFSLLSTHIRQHFYYTEEDVVKLYYTSKELNNEDLKVIYQIFKRTGYVAHNYCDIIFNYIKGKKYKDIKAIKLMDELINNKSVLNNREIFSIIEFLKIVKGYNKQQIKEFIIENKNRMEYDKILTERLLREHDLLYILNDIKNNEISDIYKNIKKSKNLKTENTKKNYEYIISEIYRNNKNSLVMPMQYPTFSIEKLKQDLKDSPYYDKLLFISNEENFKQALQKYKTEEIFRDMFGESFGHCTELGNTLIAENVAETILKLYN